MPKRVLILYGATEGQTPKIASFVADRLKQKGFDVVLEDAASTDADIPISAMTAPSSRRPFT